MKDETLKTLKDISNKLDQLVILWKLNNPQIINDFKNKIKRDKIFSKILEYADGSLTYSELSKEVATNTNSAEITVLKKISRLKDWKILITERKGKGVYYKNSGLLD